MALLISLRNKISKFINFSTEEKFNFLKYSIYFSFFHLFFWIVGYSNTKKTINHIILPRIQKTDNKVNLKAGHLSEIINISFTNSIFKSTCLERSLFIYFILGLNGIKSNIKIGVDKNGEDLSAHAWVKHGDIILNDSIENTKKYKIIDMI